jgi:hypothetical protein
MHVLNVHTDKSLQTEAQMTGPISRLVREGAPQRQESNFLTETVKREKSLVTSPEWARHQDLLTD